MIYLGLFIKIFRLVENGSFRNITITMGNEGFDRL